MKSAIGFTHREGGFPERKYGILKLYLGVLTWPRIARYHNKHGYQGAIGKINGFRPEDRDI